MKRVFADAITSDRVFLLNNLFLLLFTGSFVNFLFALRFFLINSIRSFVNFVLSVYEIAIAQIRNLEWADLCENACTAAADDAVVAKISDTSLDSEKHNLLRLLRGAFKRVTNIAATCHIHFFFLRNKKKNKFFRSSNNHFRNFTQFADIWVSQLLFGVDCSQKNDSHNIP